MAYLLLAPLLASNFAKSSLDFGGCHKFWWLVLVVLFVFIHVTVIQVRKVVIVVLLNVPLIIVVKCAGFLVLAYQWGEG